jgi:hypothetical protein
VEEGHGHDPHPHVAEADSASVAVGPAPYGLSATLKVGVLVSVTGSKGTDGSVTATSVTARPA